MKKLNSRGITTIEIIVCFVLVVIMTISMYSTISTFNQKRLIESYKSRIYTYKNILTKDIQDDIIKKGLTHASYTRKATGSNVVYTINFDLKDGSKRKLIIHQTLAYSDYHIEGDPSVDDYFMVQYGDPTKSDGLIEYPIPDLGESRNSSGHVVKDLSINNIIINISENNFLSIYMGFYHPELGTRYGVNIISPINFITAGSDEVTGF